MRFYFKIIISLGTITPLFSQQVFRNRYKENETEAIPERLINTMKSYYDDGFTKIANLKHERFMFEISPFYEQGYVFSEIIERYKKMVDIAKRATQYKSTTLFEAVKYVELIQKLYFEVYHLINMMHEIPKKYNDIPEFKDQVGVAVFSTMSELDQKKAYLKKKARLKHLRELRELRLKFGEMQEDIPKTRDSVWPLEYGWEIDRDYIKWPHLGK